MTPHGTVGDYVPFYYAPRSPMMFNIHTGRVPGYNQGQGPLVYVWSYLSTVAEHGLRWVASDGNSAHSLSEFTNDWGRLASFVDWPIMHERMWHNTADDGDRMRRRMAEILVHQRFPLAAVGVS